MTRLRLGALTGAILGVVVAGSLISAEPSSNDAIRKVVDDSIKLYAAAYEKRDAKALAELFTPEAEYIDSSGLVFHGRTAIEKEFAAAFPSAPVGALAFDVVSIRPVADTVIVEEGVSLFVPKDAGARLQTRYTATHVKQADGQWRLASVRELAAPVVAAHDRLGALAWLVGKWREEVDGVVTETEWSWTEEGSFLLGKFQSRRGDQVLHAGSHRIGWDAGRNQFHSWIFDAHGAFAEGVWTAIGPASWTVTLEGTAIDGAATRSLLAYSRQGEDTAIVSLTLRTHGGDLLPDDAHRIVRQPPAPPQN